jgi:hypothetical protein
MKKQLAYCLRNDFTYRVIPDPIRNPVFSTWIPAFAGMTTLETNVKLLLKDRTSKSTKQKQAPHPGPLPSGEREIRERGRRACLPSPISEWKRRAYLPSPLRERGRLGYLPSPLGERAGVRGDREQLLSRVDRKFDDIPSGRSYE